MTDLATNVHSHGDNLDVLRRYNVILRDESGSQR